MNKFSKEYVCASIGHKDPLHDTKELKKICYDKNNARNRCILTRKKANGELTSLEELRNSEIEAEEVLPDETID